MAISKNMWLKGASQRLGGVVLYQAKGETRMRELAPSVSNPRTEGQMTQRVKLANLVNFYRTSRAWMQRAFEVKPNNNSDYNRFVSLNLTNNRIYLTKQEANAGACIVDAYRVTEGTLPSVEVSTSGDNWVTNLYLTGLPALTENTTVSAFASALLAANAGLLAGDQISFIRLSQQTNPNNSLPYMIVRAYEVLLDVSNSAKLGDYLPLDYFNITTVEGNDALGVVNSGNAGGFVLIVSRTIGSRIAVSSQDVIVANNEALINSHSSEAAKQTAIDSYGQGDEVFLSSSSASSYGQQAIPLAVLSATLGNDSYTAGDIGPALEDIEQSDSEIAFNADIPEGSYTVTIFRWAGDEETALWGTVTGTASGNKITFVTPTASSEIASSKLSSIVVTVGSVQYSIGFDSGSLG